MTFATELQTERLHLRPWRARDVEPFAAMNADPRVREHFPSTRSVEASARWQARIAQHGWRLWAAERHRSREFIGFVGLEVPAATLPCSPRVEVGWRLDFAYGDRSDATAIGLERLGFDEIVSFTAVGHRRSRAVMARLGSTESDPTLEHPAVPAISPVRAHRRYRLRRTKWLAMAAVAVEKARLDQASSCRR